MPHTPRNCAVLLVNLGSPDAPTAAAVRRYLFEFLHDHRVIDTSRWVWCPILHGIILRVRPPRVAKAYASIWHEPEHLEVVEGAEAPLVRITRAQAAGLAARLGCRVEVAMRYGNPSIRDVIDQLRADGITRIAVLPAYPQYAGATTGSVYDGVAKALMGRDRWMRRDGPPPRDVPELRFLRDYYREPAFIGALAASLREHLGGLDWEPQRVLASYHGLPKRYVDEGDPYRAECEATTALLAEALREGPEVMTTFQSRFGPAEWLTPYTDKTLEALPGEGITRVAVMMPGFSADCLETLEEIAVEARDSFLAAGGTHFTAVPCLNAREDHLDALASIARGRLLPGWLEEVEQRLDT